MKPSLTTHKPTSEAGFSVLEILIVVAMISVITGFAIIQIVQSRQDMTRANAAQLMAAQLERARLDSLRRHPTASAQMAQITIINASFYSLAIDADGNGVLDAPQVISLPTSSGLQFNTPYPRTIYFNWRGRTVDAAGAPANPAFISISANGRASRIDLTPAGEPSLTGPPPSSAVTNSTAPAPQFRDHTQIP
jgi:type II secretory pathway pseudopilin PulG